jgi:hypothetical protein
MGQPSNYTEPTIAARNHVHRPVTSSVPIEPCSTLNLNCLNRIRSSRRRRRPETGWPSVAPGSRPATMATTFLRNLVLRPALRQQPLALPKPAPIARAFSTTPAQSATLMQVLRVRYLHPAPPISPPPDISNQHLPRNRAAANPNAPATPSPRPSQPSTRPRSRACA